MIMEKPEMELIVFEQDDIIVTSTPGCPYDCPNDGSELCMTDNESEGE